MKREDLEKLGLSKEQIDSVMGLHGADIETHKTKVTELTAERDAMKTQLTEANTAIEGFKKLDVTAIQKAADEYKAKFEQATQESAAQMAKVKFDHALEFALIGAKAKNVKTLLPLLSMEQIKLKDDGSLEGLDKQLEAIRKENGYLFSDTKEPPKIVTGGNNQTVITDAFEAAMLKGAGIKPSEGK